MRPSNNKSRSRNKSGNSGGSHNNQRRNIGNVINRVFESAGPDGKVRGTPQQIIDKYQGLARDAQLAGDRVAAESFLQHSEHYSRLLGEAQSQQTEQRPDQGDPPRSDEIAETRREPQPEPYREPYRQQPERPPVASGLTTIDPSDQDGAEDLSGPVDTPESARRPAPAPQPDLAAAQPVNGAGYLPSGEPQAAPVKRPRPRRKAKPDVADAPAQVD